MKNIIYLLLLFTCSNMLVAQRSKNVKKALNTTNPSEYKEKMDQLNKEGNNTMSTIKNPDSTLKETAKNITKDSDKSEKLTFFDSTASSNKDGNTIKSKMASKSKKKKEAKGEDSKSKKGDSVVATTANKSSVKPADSQVTKVVDTSIKFEIPNAKTPINTAVSNGVPEVEYVDAVAPRQLKYKADEKDVDHFEELRVKFDQEQAVAAQKAKDSAAKAQAEALKEYNARHATPMQQTEFEQFRYGERGVPVAKKEETPQESYNELFK